MTSQWTEDPPSHQSSGLPWHAWLGTKHHTTTSYNPAANGILERVHHSFKASLMACCQHPDWKAQLPCVLLGVRTAPKSNSDPFPAEKVYWETLTVPGKFFPTDSEDPDIPLARLRAAAQKFVPCRETYIDRAKQFCPRALDSSSTSAALLKMRNLTHILPAADSSPTSITILKTLAASPANVGTHFLVYTGACRSLLPVFSQPTKPPQPPDV
ncbi:uncharacterized protein LOC135222536 [Macrobrachium nipponense]|uniref:uncharacterized protein LOC135222536 n=1 Tax=Macrobrachium nipponense TaxID=159736 RepID=UPI0030C8BEDC